MDNPEVVRCPVEVLTEEGDTYSITELVWDPKNEKFYLKVILNEE